VFDAWILWTNSGHTSDSVLALRVPFLSLAILFALALFLFQLDYANWTSVSRPSNFLRKPQAIRQTMPHGRIRDAVLVDK